MPSTKSDTKTRRRESLRSHTIARLYQRWTLDCVVEIVWSISHDFYSRPRQYRLVSEDTSDILQDFLYLTGTDSGFPDLQKRKMIYGPMLGPSDGRVGEHTSQFHMNSRALRKKADDFTNRVFDSGEENLRRAFRDEAITLRSYLETLRSNSVVENVDRQTQNIFEKAVQVLRDEIITGVFGRPPASLENWPLGETFDTNGAQLIEEVTRVLETYTATVDHSQFIVMQRIADFGARTIEAILDADLTPDRPSAEINQVIQLAYSWKTALDALNSQSATLEIATRDAGL